MIYLSIWVERKFIWNLDQDMKLVKKILILYMGLYEIEWTSYENLCFFSFLPFFQFRPEKVKRRYGVMKWKF